MMDAGVSLETRNLSRHFGDRKAVDDVSLRIRAGETYGLLGGLFWSLDSLPWFLRWLSYLMPVTYANSAVRDVMIRGATILDWSVASNLLILAGFAIAFVFLASLTLKREVA